MKKQEIYDKLIAFFEQNMPNVETELQYESPFQLLVAVILSAQCTDKRVNIITPPLFRDFPTAEVMAETTPEVMYEYVKSVSYPNNKAKHLVGMAKMLMKDFGGEVPDNLDDLVKLPGVGRKTANVIQAVVYVEKELTKHFPDEIIPKAHHWLLLHGRYICQARVPKCEKCGIKELCKYFKSHYHPKKA